MNLSSRWIDSLINNHRNTSKASRTHLNRLARVKARLEGGPVGEAQPEEEHRRSLDVWEGWIGGFEGSVGRRGRRSHPPDKRMRESQPAHLPVVHHQNQQSFPPQHTLVLSRRASISRVRRDRNSVSFATCLRRAASARLRRAGSMAPSEEEAVAVEAAAGVSAGVVVGTVGAEGVVPGGKKARARSRGRRTPWASTVVCASRAA